MLQRIKGTQDFINTTALNWLIATSRKHLELYNFSEISLPILEPVELFKRSLGLHTDVVSKEMYLVGTGRDEEEVMCLRPEATASTMRAFFNNGIQDRPWKVFSHGPMFRHERPQKGRFRQFHQISIEMLGCKDIAYDVELLAMLDSLFTEKLPLGPYALSINFLGSPEDRDFYKAALHRYLDSKSNLPKAIQERKETNILRIFDLKDEACQEALADAPVLTEFLSSESTTEWNTLQKMLGQLSVSFTHNPRLVRGLDYYNKTVFEFTSTSLGAQSAFCGGGRYDYLSQTLGEKELLPSLGAAPGIERILMIMEARQQDLGIHKNPLVAVLPFSEAQKTLALLCSQELRAQNVCTETLCDGSSIKSLMRQANRLGARYTIIFGENEQLHNYATVKNMVTGSEERVVQAQLATFIKEHVA